jgi:hypothetical protein
MELVPDIVVIGDPQEQSPEPFGVRDGQHARITVIRIAPHKLLVRLHKALQGGCRPAVRFAFHSRSTFASRSRAALATRWP